MAQLEMFSGAPTVPAAPSADQVRARLEAIFATLRCGNKPTSAECRWLNVAVPQMAQWLQNTEREAVLEEFTRLLPADQASNA